MATNLAKGAVGALGALAIAKTYFGPKKDDLAFGANGGSPSTGSVSEIRAEALNTIGLARSTRGSILITPPGVASNFASTEVARIMAFYATDFNIPGAVINTVDVRRYGVGVATKYPIGASMPDISITFIVDGQGLIQKFFHNWLNQITNFNSRDPQMAIAKYGANLFDVAYKNAISVVDACLFINSENTSSLTSVDADKPIITYRIQGLFPIAMSDVNMSWAASNGLATMTVKFAYESYSIDEDANITAKPYSDTLPSLTGMQQVVRGATVVQAVSALKRPRNVSDIINVVNNTAMIASVVKKW